MEFNFRCSLYCYEMVWAWAPVPVSNIQYSIFSAYYKRTVMPPKYFRSALRKRPSVPDGNTIAPSVNQPVTIVIVSQSKQIKIMNHRTGIVSVQVVESKRRSSLTSARKLTSRCPRMSRDYPLAWTEWLYQAHLSKMV